MKIEYKSHDFVLTDIGYTTIVELLLPHRTIGLALTKGYNYTKDVEIQKICDKLLKQARTTKIRRD